MKKIIWFIVSSFLVIVMGIAMLLAYSFITGMATYVFERTLEMVLRPVFKLFSFLFMKSRIVVDSFLQHKYLVLIVILVGGFFMRKRMYRILSHFIKDLGEKAIKKAK